MKRLFIRLKGVLDVKKRILIIVGVLVLIASVISLVHTVNQINTKGRYLDFTAYYPCKDTTTDNDNCWQFKVDKSEECNDCCDDPAITCTYKDKVIDKWLTEPRVTKNDFKQEDLENVIDFTVRKDGYSFVYFRVPLLDSHDDVKDETWNYAYFIVFKIGDYRFDFHSFDKATEEMAEFHNIYKNADECIKAIKSFEPIAEKMIDEATARYNSLLAVIIVSALAMTASVAVLVIVFIRQKKSQKVIAEN